MEYGIKTSSILASLEYQFSSADAEAYEIKQFMPDFSFRLKEFLEDYYNESFRGATDSQLTSAILKLAEIKGINLAKTTIVTWLQENSNRDPCLNIEKDDTRLNMYKLAAVLDLDYYNTCDLFEKVFFARPFNPKSMQEIAFLYYASKHDKNWYSDGVELILKIETAGDSSQITENCGKKTDSKRILADVSSLDSTEDLESYLKRNCASFTKSSNNSAARKKIQEYADTAKRISGAVSNDDLIATITGYKSRAVGNGHIGDITALRSLPRHLAMKFPNGTILSNILAGRDTSLISTYKMLVLLIFYCYFKNNHVTSAAGKTGSTKTDFRAFLNFANLELEHVGYSRLYPKQPFSGLILYCAAQPEPLDALKKFISHEISEASADTIREKLSRAFPKLPQNSLTSLIEICGNRNPFLIDLICKNADCIDGQSLDKIIGCFDLSYISDKEYMDYQEMLAIRQLCICNRFSRLEGAALFRCAETVPGAGLDREFFNTQSEETVRKLIRRGWLETGRDNRIYMDSHVKSAIRSCFLGKHLVDEYFIADSLAKDAHNERKPSLNRSIR